MNRELHKVAACSANTDKAQKKKKKEKNSTKRKKNKQKPADNMNNVHAKYFFFSLLSETNALSRACSALTATLG